MAIEKRIGAYSAYAIAVENGFTGTEKEWLESLIGPRGYQGWGVSAVSVSADGSLIFTVQNPETGETRELEPIQIETLNALNSISTAKDEAISEVKKAQTQATEAVGTAKTQAVQAVEDAENTGVSAVEDAKSNALTDVGEAKTTAVDAVNAAGTQAASDAQTAITAAKNQAVSDVQNAGQSAVGAVEEAQTAGVQAVEDAQTNAVQAVQNAGTAEAEKISGLLPVPTEADAGKVPVAKPDGTGYELGESGVQIDDTKTALDTTWSSQNIVSRLCPPFTTEGAIVTCQPVEGSRLNTVVQIEPVQEGTGDPNPENVRPIRGWDAVNVVNFTGKNLIDFKLATPYSDGTIEILENGVKWSGIYYFAIPVSFPLKKGEAITASWISNVGAGQKWRVRYTDGSYSIITDNGTSLQLDDIKTVSELMIYKNADWEDHGENMVYENIQLEYGTQSTSYEPYSKSNTVTVSLGQTVYGGTLDVTTGVLTVTHAEYIEDGNREFEVSYFPTLVLPSVPAGTEGRKTSSVISNIFSSVGWSNESATNIQIRNVDTVLSGLSTNEEFKSYFKGMYDAGNPATFVYLLAKPEIIQLTLTEVRALSGVNTIYADTGDVTVSGYSDPNAIINSLADRIAALEQNAIGG